MSLYSDVINIQPVVGNYSDEFCYKLGHADAKDRAAALALEADAKLKQALDLLEGMVNPFARGTEQERHTAVLKFLMENKRCV